ncbi:MAG: TMEM175 family protein [Nocardioides sp.]
MRTGRLEAFSDGVLAIIITVMVLELKVPDHGKDSLGDLMSTSGLGLLTYLLSFVYIGIYWNNHHHMFQIVDYVDGTILWANLHLLFWLSLYPFTTAWLDESKVALTPTVIYGVNLLGAAIAYYVMQLRMMRMPVSGPRLREVVGRDLKGKLSPVIYLSGIALAFVVPWLGLVPFVIVALIWLVPDRRVERYLAEHRELAD